MYVYVIRFTKPDTITYLEFQEIPFSNIQDTVALCQYSYVLLDSSTMIFLEFIATFFTAHINSPFSVYVDALRQYCN